MTVRPDDEKCSFNQNESIENYLSGSVRAIDGISRNQVSNMIDLLFECWLCDGCVYIVGNGGSAATASHMMNDLLRSTCVRDARPLRAMSLTDNSPLITAIGNDVDFEEIFSEVLCSFVKPEDIVIAISTSGTSPNILQAVSKARHRGIRVIALCGKNPSTLSAMADSVVSVPAQLIGQQEDGHLVINHCVVRVLKRRIESYQHAGSSQG